MIEGSNAPSYDYATFPRHFLAYRWFKPLLVVLLGFVFMLVFQMIVLVLGIALNYVENGFTIDWSAIEGVGETVNANYFTAPGAFIGIGAVAVMLPALALAALIVRDRPFSSYSSSRGGFNRGAFFKCLGVAAVIYVALTVVQVVAFPDENAAAEAVAFTVSGFILVTLLVPIQAAAEEYVYRGLALQAFSSWTKLPVVGIVVSALLFTVSHGYNLIGLIAIFVGAIIWGVLTWQTKGIEASCASHIVNNLSGFYTAGLGLSTISEEIDIASMVIAVIIDVLYAVAIILLGKKFNWFTSKGDGTAKANEKYRAKMAAKQAAQQTTQFAQNAPVASVSYTQQPIQQAQNVPVAPASYVQQPVQQVQNASSAPASDIQQPAQPVQSTQQPQAGWQSQQIQPTRLAQPQDWQLPPRDEGQ